MFGCLAPFGEQLIGQGCAGLQVFSGALLCTLDATLLSRDAQLIVLNSKHYFVSDFDS
jgi:hypothetical protein